MELLIGGRAFSARMLTLGTMKAIRHDVNTVIRMISRAQKLGPKTKASGLSLDEALDVMSPEETQSTQRVIYASLIDPGMPETEFVSFTDGLPWNTAPVDLMMAVLMVMLNVADGTKEGSSPGEAASPESSISSGSTGSSSPEPAGPSSTSTD